MAKNDEIRKKSLITAIKTPYLKNRSIDIQAYDRLIKRQIMHGVDGVIVGGTTGEGHLMDWEEHLELIRHSVQHYGKDLLIVGNTGSNNTKESVFATREGFKAGMHAALLINPYYGKTSSQGMLEHLKRGLDVGPGIIYSVPQRTAQEISVAVMEQLAKHPNFVGVKECIKERIPLYYKLGIACWSGNDDTAFELRHKEKSLGVISVASNVIPSWMRKLIDVDDPALNTNLLPVFDWLFQEPNPIPLNSLLADMRLISPVFRLPYLPLPYQARKTGLDLIKNLMPAEVDIGLKVLEDQDFVIV